jgi:phosphohistidine phosphatase SixA
MAAKKAAAAVRRGDDEGSRGIEITGRAISPQAINPDQVKLQAAAPSRRTRETASNKVAAHFSIADGRQPRVPTGRSA